MRPGKKIMAALLILGRGIRPARSPSPTKRGAGAGRRPKPRPSSGAGAAPLGHDYRCGRRAGHPRPRRPQRRRREHGAHRRRGGRPLRQVRAAVIDFGGFLGVGSRKIAVDWARCISAAHRQEANASRLSSRGIRSRRRPNTRRASRSSCSARPAACSRCASPLEAREN